VRIASLEQGFGEVASRVETLDQRVSRAEARTEIALEGVAVALSLADPTLAAGDAFGMRVNWGHYDGKSAIGVSMLGVLGRDLFGFGETLAIGGGVGVGLADGSVGGRVGVQLTWK
jgi:hypothetical protein